jgi:hypothetical protein
MPELARRLAVLRWIGRSRRPTVHAAALRAAEGAEVPQLAAQVMRDCYDQATPAQLAALIGAWDHLPVDHKRYVQDLAAPAWEDICTSLADDPLVRNRFGLMAAVGEGPVVQGATVAVALLADRDATVADAAERALSELARLARSAALTDAERERVLTSMDRAIETFDAHRRTGVLRTAIRLAPLAAGSPGARARQAWMNDPTHPAHLVLRGIIKRGDDPALRWCAWSWLKYDALAPACIERLGQRSDASTYEQVLTRWPLLLHSARTGAMVKARMTQTQAAAMLPRLADADRLPAAARIGLVKMIERAPIDGRLKDAAWAARLGDPELPVRVSLVRACALAARPSSVLMDLMFDVDPRVAQLAASAVLARGAGESIVASDRQRLAGAVARSTHAGLRRLGEQLEQGRLQPGLRLEQLQQIIDAFVGAGAAASSLSRRAASAALAMGKSTEPGALEAIGRCLSVADDRVRANAVEALTVRARRAGGTEIDQIADTLLDCAIDAQHRVRANAARGLILLGASRGASSELTTTGRRTLGEMLTDARPMHRVAGLWLTERVAPVLVELTPRASGAGALGGELLDRLQAIIGAGASDAEVARAQRAASRLAIEARAQWSRRAAVLHAGAPVLAQTLTSEAQGVAA